MIFHGYNPQSQPLSPFQALDYEALCCQAALCAGRLWKSAPWPELVPAVLALGQRGGQLVGGDWNIGLFSWLILANNGEFLVTDWWFGTMEFYDFPYIVGIAIKNRPSNHIGFAWWYVYHSQSWVVYCCFTDIKSIWLVVWNMNGL